MAVGKRWSNSEEAGAALDENVEIPYNDRQSPGMVREAVNDSGPFSEEET
jgi:hypothetical protein